MHPRCAVARSCSPRRGTATVEHLVETAPLTRNVVHRFVPGPTEDDAVAATRRLVADGLPVSLDHLGEDTTDPEQAAAAAKAYLSVLDRLADRGADAAAPRSAVKLSAVGQALPGDGERIALDNAHLVCAAAAAGRHDGHARHGGPHHDRLDAADPAELRKDFPATGAVLQAYLRRTEADCRDLATPARGSGCARARTRSPVASRTRTAAEVDKSYVRCLTVLMAGAGLPDDRHPRPAADRDRRRPGAAQRPRAAAAYEFQMLYGIRPNEQRRLAELGDTVRVYMPYGDEWYGYFMRRLAERPANVAFFLRALATRSMSRRRGPRRRQDRRGAAVRAAARRPAGRRADRRRAPAPSGPRSSTERYGVRAVPTPRRPSAPTCCWSPSSRRTSSGAARRAGAARAAPDAGRVRWPPASRPPSTSSGCRAGVPVVRVMPNTPVLVDEAMSAISAGAHAERASTWR